MLIIHSKKSTKPVFLCQMEALLRRLSVSHPKRKQIEDEYAKAAAGFRGEQTVEYFLKEVSGPIAIFHDIRLKTPNFSFFQIDFIVFTPFFLAIVECKNYIGHLSFETNTKQLIRTFDGKETVLPDAILQMRRQSKHLNDWLQLHQLPQMPVYSYVVLAHPSNRVTITPSSLDYERRIIRAIELPETFQTLFQRHTQLFLNETTFARASRLIAKHHTPFRPNILLHFSISPSDIRTGIFCPSCKKTSVLRAQRKWYCLSCDVKLQAPHLTASKDYSLLFGERTTKQHFSSFLGVSSPAVGYRILKSFHAKEIGKTKSRVYILPEWLQNYEP